MDLRRRIERLEERTVPGPQRGNLNALTDAELDELEGLLVKTEAGGELPPAESERARELLQKAGWDDIAPETAPIDADSCVFRAAHRLGS